MKAWMVRGGRLGEAEALALEKGLACIGFVEAPDLRTAKTKEEMRQLIAATWPEASEAKLSNFTGQLFSFAQRIEKGDLVAMPLKNQPQIALGIITGDYEYRADLGETHHVRRVNWLKTDVSRSLFKQDLLYSLGAFMTVCQIQRNNAAARIKAIIDGKSDPGYQEAGDNADKSELEAISESVAIDLEEQARDQIRKYIEANFKGHRLAHLVNAVLQAEGYVTHLSPPGPDGGADILARRGSLGLEGAKLCVQVKSSQYAADVTVLRNLQGTMSTFKADEGLLVCWGGFNQIVQKEARLSFFSVRLWDADDLLAAIQRNYERLPEELRKEIPLKRIWTLVLEE
jgi:restriction system protein